MSAPRLTEFIKAYDVRGLVPQQLNDAVAFAIGSAFAQVVASPEGATSIVVGHDMRDSSPGLSRSFAAGVAAQGLDVVLIGLCSTDGLYYASGSLGVPGAMFTASHNPAEYNGIKLCRAGARPVGQDTGLADIRDLAQSLLDSAHAAGEDAAGASATDARATDARATDAPAVEELQGAPAGNISERDLLPDYAQFLRDLVDLSDLRPLTVVVDAGNGMGGHTVPAVLGSTTGTPAGLPALPLTVIPLYFELDGSFPNHEANPLDPKNLVDLQAAVLAHGADLGLAFDGDADRCFVVDERGEPVSPSAITALVGTREVAKELAAGRPRPTVVYNVISSAAVPELIGEAGAIAVRTRVGHSFIKDEMARVQAVFGGEHSAHYYFRDFWFADTGMLAAMHVLAALGEQAGPLSELVAEFSRYSASGEINSTVADADAATADVRDWALAIGLETAGLAGGDDLEFDELDGMTVTHGGDPMWWFNLRASNTEPLLRLNVEASDQATMERIRDDVLSIVRGEKMTKEPVSPVSAPVPASAAETAAPAAGESSAERIEPWLRGILRCPQCRSTLSDGSGPGGPELHCTKKQCHRAYRIDDGIPVLLVDEARLLAN
ncbi:MAG: phosphomannomutase [Actinomycetota bacterium]|nr:phosphomannomutase [Actinomycetota bacterium]